MKNRNCVDRKRDAYIIHQVDKKQDEAAWLSGEGTGLEIQRSRVPGSSLLSWRCFLVDPSSTPRSCL